MIELLFAPTPNVWKITIFLEEAALQYRLTPVDLASGEHYSAKITQLAPNNRLPAIVDHAPSNGSTSLYVFESGAILLYLAEKVGRFSGGTSTERSVVRQWLFWQVSALGPILGQHGHFALYAADKIPYAIDRFRHEARRLYAVLDSQLAKTGAFIAGENYTIADMACFPWIMTHKAQGFTLNDWPNVGRWFATLRAREALQRGLTAGKGLIAHRPLSEGERRQIFGIAGEAPS